MSNHGTIITVGETKIQVTNNEIVSEPPVKASLAKGESISFSLFPPIALGIRDEERPYLVVGLLIDFWLFFFFFNKHNESFFNFLLAISLFCIQLYYFYQLCGKHKPWWILGILFLTTLILMTILTTPIVLELPFMWGDSREIPVGRVYTFLAYPFRQFFRERPSNEDFLPMLTYYFFDTGLPEELIKALPIFGLSWLSQKINPAWRNKVEVTKPLDGIIFGAASGLGFALCESVQYALDSSATYGKLTGGLTTADCSNCTYDWSYSFQRILRLLHWLKQLKT